MEKTNTTGRFESIARYPCINILLSLFYRMKCSSHNSIFCCTAFIEYSQICIKFYVNELYELFRWLDTGGGGTQLFFGGGRGRNVRRGAPKWVSKN